MSATISVPKGIDTLSADDTRLLDAMRAEEAPPPGSEASDPAPAARERTPPAPEPAAEPDAADADDDAAPVTEEGPGKQKLIPHAQFHAANEKRKVAEAKAAAAELKLATETARVQTRLDMLQAAWQASTAPAPVAAPAVEIPDVNIDPVGHFQARLAQAEAGRAELAAGFKQIQDREQQQRQFAELRNHSFSQEVAFKSREPSYDDAMAFLTAGRHAELEKIGVTDPMERARILGNDVAQIAMRARQEGADFAERLYGLAEARGFKKAVPAAAATPPGTTTIGGIAVPPMDATIDVPAAAARIANGRENSTTIGSLGAAPPTRLSVEKIANMSDAEFEALTGKMNPAELRNLMGN